MTKGTFMLLLICLASIISFAKSDTLLRRNSNSFTFSKDIFKTRSSGTVIIDEVNYGLLAIERPGSKFIF
ncbi:MAG: hypothetical protein WC716_07725 [Chitinophagaceae bacterium]